MRGKRAKELRRISRSIAAKLPTRRTVGWMTVKYAGYRRIYQDLKQQWRRRRAS